MYRLVRNFSIASAVAIVIVTVILGLVQHSTLKRELVVTTEMQNATFARTYANALEADLLHFIQIS
ncbi:MAG TPA: hypothetical protein VIN57_02760, partial [Magnetovibrio sp.]